MQRGAALRHSSYAQLSEEVQAVKVQELGHIVLYVSDISRSRRFYRDVLGWSEVGEAFGGRAVAFSSGRTHHELLLIEVGEGARTNPPPPRRGRRREGGIGGGRDVVVSNG